MNGHYTAASTGDAAVDALVELAAQTAQLPVSEHKERYTQVLAGLEHELDADPGAATNGATPRGAES